MSGLPELRPGPLFICMACRVAMAANTPCGRCGFDSMRDGIMDFVAGAAGTALDELDYDAVYGVSLEKADQAAARVKEGLAGRLPARIGTALEIGCGTGGFSAGFLRAVSIDAAVLTDISPRMLGVCRRRLGEAGIDPGKLVFATFSGVEDCLAGEAFDLCYGAGVVHHILDVPHFFATVARVLKPDGSAFFTEPNSRFHIALMHTVADVVAILIARNHDATEISRLMNWLAEVRYNLLHEGDLELLARREDKHCFSPERVRAMAAGAGLSAEMIPMGRGPLEAMDAYLGQMGFADASRATIGSLLGAAAPRYFGLLRPDEACAESIIYLRKHGEAQTAPSPRAAPPGAPLDPPARAEIVLTWRDGALDVSGWACAPVGIRRMTVRTDHGDFAGSVWLPRRDVYEAFRASYPPLHSMCCGISERYAALAPPERATVSLHMETGHVVELPSARLQDGGATIGL